jgi:hypothetical protein
VGVAREKSFDVLVFILVYHPELGAFDLFFVNCSHGQLLVRVELLLIERAFEII